MNTIRVKQGTACVWFSLINAIPVCAADSSRPDVQLLMAILYIIQYGGILAMVMGFLMFILSMFDQFPTYRMTALKFMGGGAFLTVLWRIAQSAGFF